MATSIPNLAGGNSSTGLGTGIDVQQFVQLALAGDQSQITTLQNQKGTLQAQTSALQQITTDLTNLESAAFGLSDPLGGLNGQVATSSNSNVLTANAASTAVPGAHTITVSNLATTGSYYTDPVASGSAMFGIGDFQIQIGSNAPVTVNVTSSNDTLDGLAAAINNQNIGATASVINDANGARLALVSQTTGASGDITVSNNTTRLNFNKAVTGVNASLTIDGVPISSASNTVTGVINGVTLNLTSAAPGTPISVTVNPDTSKASDAINQFVSVYNTAIKDINAQFTVNTDGTGGGPLEADGSLREAQVSLLAAISYATSGNSAVANLASIGVNLNNDGTLTVDSSALSAALNSNFSSVQSFLQGAGTGFASNLRTAVSNLADPSQGVLGLDAQGISQSTQALSQQISDLQAALAVKQQQLTSVYAQVNTTLQELPVLQAQIGQQLASA